MGPGVAFAILCRGDCDCRSCSFSVAAVGFTDQVAALMRLSAFGMNLVSPRPATLVRTDMPLALVIFLIGSLVWLENSKTGKRGMPTDRILGLRIADRCDVDQGPIVYAFLLPHSLFQLLERRRHRLPPTAPGSAGWPWARFARNFPFVGRALEFFFSLAFRCEVVMRGIRRAFRGTTSSSATVLFLLPHLLHKFAPWSVLMIALAILDLRSRRWGDYCCVSRDVPRKLFGALLELRRLARDV